MSDVLIPSSSAIGFSSRGSLSQSLLSPSPGTSPDQRYADWVEMYVSDDFAQATTRLRGEMDRLGAGITEEKRARLEDIFVVSSRYEERFWEMCWAGEAW